MAPSSQEGGAGCGRAGLLLLRGKNNRVDERRQSCEQSHTDTRASEQLQRIQQVLYECNGCEVKPDRPEGIG